MHVAVTLKQPVCNKTGLIIVQFKKAFFHKSKKEKFTVISSVLHPVL